MGHAYMRSRTASLDEVFLLVSSNQEPVAGSKVAALEFLLCSCGFGVGGRLVAGKPSHSVAKLIILHTFDVS